MSVPKVSIVCITYQHAAFIRRALDSFLAQQVSFPVEIIVHDDASTDGTADIIREYAAAHPDRFVTIFQRKNQRSLGVRPWPPCFAVARGEYIALCEGDDHWIDPLKLQRQVDALDADPNATGCFTNAYNELEGDRQPFLGGTYRMPDGLILEEAEYLRGQGVPTCTFVFRRERISDYPAVLYRFMTGDTALYTLLLGQGHFIVQPEFTGVRVMHPGGVYSLKGALHHLRVQLHNIRAQDELSQRRHHTIIAQRRAWALTNAWQEGLRTRNWPLARFAWKQLAKDRSIARWSLATTLRNGFSVHFPTTYQRVGNWQWRAKQVLKRFKPAARPSRR